jgi:hypothetical protein
MPGAKTGSRLPHLNSLNTDRPDRLWPGTKNAGATDPASIDILLNYSNRPMPAQKTVAVAQDWGK